MVQAADWHASREILGAREPYLRPYKAGTVSYEDREVDKESEYSKTDGNLQIGTIKSHGAGSLENKAIVGNYEVNWKLEKLQTDHGAELRVRTAGRVGRNEESTARTANGGPGWV